MMNREAIRTLIVEDNASEREFLADMLREHFHKRIQLVGEASSLEEAESLYRKKRPALLLLDVEMQGDLTTFDLLDRLQRTGELEGTGVIFLTSSVREGYRDKAFDHAALHFLNKPVRKSELDDAIKRYEQKDYARSITKEQVGMLLSPTPAILQVPLIKGILEIVDIADILYLESHGEMTDIFLVDGTHLLAMKHLGHFEDTLDIHIRFERISRNHIVNVEHVIRFNPRERMLMIRNKKALSVSRRRLPNFRSKLDQLNGSPSKGFGGLFRGLFGG